jgi:hypothetical protein
MVSVTLSFAFYTSVIASMLMLLFRVSEFVIMRIAEHEKGTILGVAALLTALGALVWVLFEPNFCND